jgi:hypothetical protein
MISILFLAADPTDASRLRLGEEFREIQEKLQLSKWRDNFTLQQRMSVRPTDISQALLDVNPRIVHFSGHGTSSGALCLENKLGESHPIQPEALAALFEQFADQLDCVVLNACYSVAQAKAIAKHIRHVVGMNQAIGDKAAIAFSIGFYQALGAGRSVEEAYKLGCVQIRLENIPEYLTPILIKDHDVSGLIGPVSGQLHTEGPRTSATEVKPPAVIRPINLSFDGPTIGGQPTGWFNSLGHVDGVSIDYEVSVLPRSEGGSGACVLFQNLRAAPDEFGSFMQRCPAKYLAGKAIRFEGEVKTKNIEQWAGLWLRADGDIVPTLFFDNMHKRPICGTTSWTRYMIDAQLPKETAWLNYGIVLAGRGMMWADNFRLLVWDKSEWKEV